MLKFIDLSEQYGRLEDRIQSRIGRVLQSGQFIKGEEVAELERQLADYVGVKHCVGVANGTDALLIALMAAGVRAGDEVIVPDFTFVAPAEMVLLLGAKPILVDINPATYNIDTSLLAQAITAKTKAIIPVSLYGQCADFEAINAIAAKNDITVIEDAAQSFGATQHGIKSCNLSTSACTSFFPSKPLGCYGDGGACFTNDDELAKQMRIIADHGQVARYQHDRLGLNSRLDTLQAAILLEKLSHFPWELEQRQKIAAKYDELLSDVVQVPQIVAHNSSVFAQYTIRSSQRDKIQQRLQKAEIPTAIHYQKALHHQPVFADCRVIGGDESVKAAQEVISLPFHPYLNESDQELIAKAIIEAVK